MAESVGYVIGYIIGALAIAIGAAFFNFYWCATRHKRPMLGYFPAFTSFFCGIAGGIILAGPTTLFFSLIGYLISKKEKTFLLKAPLIPLKSQEPQDREKAAS